jgi:nucleotide-binding universal stress UspA family protein
MYKQILVPLDGSKIAECCLTHVKEIATHCQVAEVILLTAIEHVGYPYLLPGDPLEDPNILVDNERKKNLIFQKASQYLEMISKRLKLEGIESQTLIMEEKENQKAGDIILDYALNNQIDLIVMSTHGRTGISRWTMGSVADKVVRHSPVPVLTVAPVGCRA